MKFIEIDRDEATGLVLVRDTSDPPRYYIEKRRARDLIAIGDLCEAQRHFAARLRRLRWRAIAGGSDSAMPPPAAEAAWNTPGHVRPS